MRHRRLWKLSLSNVGCGRRGGHQGETDLWRGTAWYRREFIKEVPEFLKDSTVIRTAKADAGYWAADYIQATAGKELDLYVAHDQKAEVPD
jgi:hypothetical protein